MHRVAVLIELGEYSQAIECAAQINEFVLSPERQARLALDVARANAALRSASH